MTDIAEEAFQGCTGLSSVTIGSGVKSIGDYAFNNCPSLTVLMIPASVTNAGDYAFGWCEDLTNTFFLGNAPLVDGAPGNSDTSVFLGENGAVYHLPGATGWQDTFGGWHVEQWDHPGPVINAAGSSLGMQSNGFNFTVAWVPNTTVVVQACTNLADPVWLPVSTNTLTDGILNFRDNQWINSVQRFYRVASE